MSSKFGHRVTSGSPLETPEEEAREEKRRESRRNAQARHNEALRLRIGREAQLREIAWKRQYIRISKASAFLIREGADG